MLNNCYLNTNSSVLGRSNTPSAKNRAKLQKKSHICKQIRIFFSFANQDVNKASLYFASVDGE